MELLIDRNGVCKRGWYSVSNRAVTFIGHNYKIIR